MSINNPVLFLILWPLNLHLVLSDQFLDSVSVPLSVALLLFPSVCLSVCTLLCKHVACIIGLLCDCGGDNAPASHGCSRAPVT